MSKTDNPTPAEDSNTTVSRKREITAVVASTTVTVLLGLAATAAIEQVGRRVKHVIAPTNETK